MLDDFREQGGDPFFGEEEDLDLVPDLPARPRKDFLGMTPFQRLLIVLMLLVLSCLLSTFCLLVTQKVVPPFMF